MKKTWTLGNGFYRVNDYGQSQLCEIGPRDFDPDYEEMMEAGVDGRQLPYRQDGSSYVFTRKRDWLQAIDTLRSKGFVA